MILHHEMVTHLAMESHIIHMVVGVSGEVSGLLVAFVNDDQDKVLEELGGIEFYFEGLCQELDVENRRAVIERDEIISDPLLDVFIHASNMFDIVKKLVFYKDASDLDALRTEMQVFRDALDQFYAVTEFTHHQALVANIEKLRTRYEGFNYSGESAQVCNDKERGMRWSIGK
jgi:hypothetical protein